jgi:hypothetical protein
MMTVPEDNRPIIVDQLRTPTGIFEHFCDHPGCKKWGGWGFSRGKATIWFCSEHRAHGERAE